MPHPDVSAEQVQLDHAHRCLAAMVARASQAEASLNVAARAGDADAAQAQAHLRRRLYSLAEGRAALCFGRISEAGGDVFYVGRRHVEDADGDPVVVDWRAPVAAPFYRATAANPQDLHARRRYVLDDRTLVDLFEEIFDDPDHPELASGGGVPDPLLAELERSRAGQLRDIVATIQAEQDVIIRAPLDRAVIVQGGPGTGKTAVGLHRAAYLLYEHRRAVLEGGRVLVIGPNRLFLRYIAEVLPSLGETAVSQHTIDTLAGARYRVRAQDPPELVALKGDRRMAAVLANALAQLGQIPADPVRLQTTAGAATLEPEALALLVKECLASVSSFSGGRSVLRKRLEAELLGRFVNRDTGAGPDEEEFFGRLRRDGEFDRLVAKLWPTTSAPALVRRVLGSPTARRKAAVGVLDADEIKALGRPSAKGVDAELWTSADLPLLDEAEALINGVPATYLHVVVDEAQDLSPMALRMVARRAPSGSLTVLGDLAQATAPAAATDWTEVAAALGVSGAVDHRHLEVGYRLPGEILDWAGLLLPEAAPTVPATRSARRTGRAPSLIRSDDVVAGCVAAVAEAADRWGLLGVVVPLALRAQLWAALRAAPFGEEVGPIEPQHIEHQVTVLGAVAAKGLEFDGTVVVEPAAIVDEPGGVRALYVALTRCVQELTVVHHRPLPAALLNPA